MGGEKSWSLLNRLKRAVRKINLLLTTGFNFSRWSLASLVLRSNASSRRLRRVSFNDRLSLKLEEAGKESPEELKSVRAIQRTKSYENNSDDDIDQRAEIFIQKFHQQLLLERQVSLQLRYHQGQSSYGIDRKEDQ